MPNVPHPWEGALAPALLGLPAPLLQPHAAVKPSIGWEPSRFWAAIIFPISVKAKSSKGPIPPELSKGLVFGLKVLAVLEWREPQLAELKHLSEIPQSPPNAIRGQRDPTCMGPEFLVQVKKSLDSDLAGEPGSPKPSTFSCLDLPKCHPVRLVWTP